MASHILPALSFGVVLNVPKILEISSVGLILEKNVDYLKFAMIYQVFHPLLTTIIIPIIILMIINYGILKKSPGSFRTNSSRR